MTEPMWNSDRIIIDDPHNVVDAESEIVRNEMVQWFREMIMAKGTKPIQRLVPAWRDPFEVPPSLIPEGMSYQWCAKRADSTDERQDDYEKMLDGGWVLVPPQWVPGGRNMIAGNDLMCRPKWMTERAQLDNAAKAAKQIDDWAERFGGFSGSVRVQTQGPGGVSEVYERPVGGPQIATRLHMQPSGIGLMEKSYEYQEVTAADVRDACAIVRVRRPRHPALRWLFNLISTEDNQS